jgi:bacteriocin-type transport-associated protein
MKKVLYILGELSDDDIDWLIAIGNREEIPAGTILIHEGQPVDALYILLDGTLAVSAAALGDKEIAKLSSGEVVGEMSFVDARRPSATVKALADAVVLAIPRAQLETKLQQDVSFASRFYRALAVFLSNRLRGTVSQMGYGKLTPGEVVESEAQLDPNVLDNLPMAAARFDWLLKRLKGSC